MEGHVTYSNAAKSRMLGVDPAVIERCGAVSEECALQMARGARRVSGADYALAVTGIAGPDGGTAEKPVGTVYIALSCAQGEQAQKFQFVGDRAWIRLLSCQNALNMLRLRLIS